MTFDHRKFWKLHLKRNHKRLLQSSSRLVRSNRANGDVSLILMRKHQMYPDADELRQICGYIVDYATKCTETESDTGCLMRNINTATFTQSMELVKAVDVHPACGALSAVPSFTVMNGKLTGRFSSRTIEQLLRE